MIKEKDLRLNNLVMVNYKTDLLSKVTWIQEGSINVIFDRQPDLINGIVCSVNDLIPIKLTEEWLLKAGFNYKNYHPTTIGSTNVFGSGLYISQMISNGFSLVFQTDKKNFYFEFSDRYINYVHELQNLYFSLTGSELVFSTEP